MKIRFNEKPKMKDYEAKTVRTRRKFLLFPKIIRKELRWLETTTWIEYVDYKMKFYDGGSIVRKCYWQPLCWADQVLEKDTEEGGKLHNATFEDWR